MLTPLVVVASKLGNNSTDSTNEALLTADCGVDTLLVVAAWQVKKFAKCIEEICKGASASSVSKSLKYFSYAKFASLDMRF